MVRGMGLYARCRPSAVAKTMHLRRREPSLHQLMRRSLASAQARLSQHGPDRGLQLGRWYLGDLHRGCRLGKYGA